MKKILSLLPKIIIAFVGLIMLGINLAVAYIMFAPDNLPKPFYLMYLMPEPTETPAPDSEASSDVIADNEASLLANLSPGQGLMIDTGSKIVNLVDPTGRKYLRVGVVLEFAPTEMNYFSMEEEEKKAYITIFNQEMESRMPVINDVLITLLTSQNFDTIYTAEGKEALRTDIKEKINSQIHEYDVIYVYFTEFVVQ